MRIYIALLYLILLVSCNDYMKTSSGYKIKGETKIVFNNFEKALNDKSVISGFVYSKDSKKFLESANLIIGNTGTITNKKGYFEIEVEPGFYDITAAFVGNNTEKVKKVKVEKNKKIIIIFELGTSVIY